MSAPVFDKTIAVRSEGRLETVESATTLFKQLSELAGAQWLTQIDETRRAIERLQELLPTLDEAKRRVMSLGAASVCEAFDREQERFEQRLWRVEGLRGVDSFEQKLERWRLMTTMVSKTVAPLHLTHRQRRNRVAFVSGVGTLAGGLGDVAFRVMPRLLWSIPSRGEMGWEIQDSQLIITQPHLTVRVPLSGIERTSLQRTSDLLILNGLWKVVLGGRSEELDLIERLIVPPIHEPESAQRRVAPTVAKQPTPVRSGTVSLPALNVLAQGTTTHFQAHKLLMAIPAGLWGLFIVQLFQINGPTPLSRTVGWCLLIFLSLLVLQSAWSTTLTWQLLADTLVINQPGRRRASISAVESHGETRRPKAQSRDS